MRKPNKNKMADVNSPFASVSESIFNGFLLKMLLRSLPVYILKQLFFSISVNSVRCGRRYNMEKVASVTVLIMTAHAGATFMTLADTPERFNKTQGG